MKHLLIIIAALLNVCTALAGGLVATQSTGTLLPVIGTTVDTKIREQVAVTTTTQLFVQDQPSERVAYGIGIPANATITSVRWLLRGTWYRAEATRSDTSGSAGGGGTSGRARNALTGAVGSNAFIFEFKDTLRTGDTLRVEITAVQLLDHSNGVMTYLYPLPRVAGRPTLPVTMWSIDIRSAFRVLQYRNALSITPTMSDTSVMEVLPDIPPASELQFEYALAYDSLIMNVLSVKPPNEDGYALMLAVPKAQVDSLDVLPKRFTFVLDKSGSMGGVKIQQAIEAARYCVSRLRPNELFAIVPFESGVHPWKPEHILASPANIKEALSFLDVQYASGGTNITGALTAALSMHKSDEYVNVIIFLTDGISDVDYAALRQANTSQTRIFVFGIGYDVNTESLTTIANEHRGAIEFVQSTSQTAERIRLLYERIREPLIKDPTVAFAPMVLKDVYPTIIPDIYAGEQLRLIGRYTTPGECVVTVSGTNSRGPAQHRFTALLTADSLVNLFLPKLWAQERISYLLELMSKEPQTSGRWKEWRDEIIRLGLTYGITTPYTTFIDSGTPDDKNPTSVFDPREMSSIPISVSPNPATMRTHIRIPIELDGVSDLTVVIMDAAGRRIRILLSAGEAHAPELGWDLTDDAGTPVPSGVYRVVITSSAGSTSTSVVVIR